MSSVEIGQQAAKVAVNWIGTPYCHQASTKLIGCDCLGLVRGVWRDLYGYEPELPPPYTPDWAERCKRETLLEAADGYLLPSKKLQVGDVLFFRMAAGSPAKHCGIYLGNSVFVHAYWGRQVCRSSLGRWWQERLVSMYSFPKKEEILWRN